MISVFLPVTAHCLVPPPPFLKRKHKKPALISYFGN